MIRRLRAAVSARRMLTFCVALLVFSTVQWPVAYLTGVGNQVWYVTGLSILALQFAAVGGIAAALADLRSPDADG